MLISGDNNRNAKVAVRYREEGSSTWRDGLPLFRVLPETVAQSVPEQFAGSIFDLAPDTTYEIELHATDMDGPMDEVRLLTGRTRAVPQADPLLPITINVTTASGLLAALTAAVPANVIVLADGIYTGTFVINRSGTAANPIVIRGQSASGVILDGANCASCSVLQISGSYIHVENLTIRNAWRAVKWTVDGLRNNVVRRVQIKDVVHGMDGGLGHLDFYACDNVVEGRLVWPWVYASDASTHWGDRGIAINGNGHVICHNVIKGFGDPIHNNNELNRSYDIYGNDFFDNYDHELDRSAGNVRLFHNRFTNIYDLSFQPINGGPAYVLRNVVYNTARAYALKFHSYCPSACEDTTGILVYHNTFVSPLRALTLLTSVTAHNFSIANNLFVGPTVPSGRTVEWDGGIGRGKFDFNGYFPDGGFRFGTNSYSNFAGLKASGVFEGGGTLLATPIFTSGIVGPTDGTIRQNPADFTLASGSNAIDRGTVLPGINQSFASAAPDLGALESGCPTPTYGPRPVGSESLVALIDCSSSGSDTTAPTVSMSSPANGAMVSGSSVTVSAAASDNVGIAGVQLKLDGANLGAEEKFLPYEIPWDTTKVANGAHTLTAVARDAAGNITTSAAISVTVANDSAPPVISSVSAFNISSFEATITWATNETSDSQVEYGPTTAYGNTTPLNLTLATAHAETPIGLLATTTYHYRVKSRDAAGNLATSADFTLTTLADITPPAVSITAPTSGSAVSGTITVAASATDNVGIVGVQFKLDGANLGAEVTAAPYTLSWNTTTATNAAHTLTAVARDAAGNTATSSNVTVTVSNDTTPPAVSMTAPAAGATVAGTVTVSASATDNVGVVGVQFKLDGANLGGEMMAAPYAVSWTTTTASNGAHTLTAVARDAAGNTSTSSAITIMVSNDLTPPLISGVSASTLSPFAVTISWTTDEGSDTQVEYGPTTAYGSATLLAPSFVTSHSQMLSGLATGALYHYRVRSRDAAGNLAVSGDFTFTTLAPPPADLVVYRPPTPITVDGMLDDWAGANALQFSGLSNGATGYLAWDAANLYVAFKVTDTQLSALQTARDAGNLWQDDSVEVYIDTLSDRASAMQPDDYQFMVNLNNVQVDLRGNGSGKDRTWNATWTSAVSRQGTLNSHGDTDSEYVVEIVIPWAQIGVTPASGMYLGLDLAMNDSDPAGATTFDTFDWARIVPNPYAQPRLWRWIQLVDTVPLPDATPPSVAIASPASGATLSGTISVAGTATDNVGVVGVQFKLDGANLGAELTAAPYSISWNTMGVTNGSHTLTAVARDAAGNTTTSSGASVTVDNAPPLLSSVASTSISSSAATITWATNEAADSQVEYGLTTAYGSATVLNASLVTAHSQALSGLSASTMYHYRVRSKDAVGNLAISGDFTFTTLAPPDTTVPTVSLTAPAAGATVAGTVSVSASATDNVGIVGVQFKLDGANLGAEVTAAPYTLSWNTTTATDAAHTLTAVARDAAGNSTTAAAVSVTVDNNHPAVSITAPTAGSTVAGTITVSASATDNVGVVGVQLKLDGANLGAEVTSAPYTLSWTTTSASNGTHSLTAVARDAAGNTATSTAVAVTVDNAAPVISAVSSSSVGSSDATITWTTDEASDSQVEYGLTSAYGQATALASALVSSHSVGLSGLSASTAYHYRVKSKDAVGNLAVSGDFTFTTQAPPDTTPPTVSMTAPAAGATVAGTVTVSASATDNVGVVGVQFKLDGANLGAEEKFLPYEIPWDTTKAANGSHTLTAVARDAAGNIATSAAVSVTVANDITPPVISSVSASNVSSSQATITWATNEASDSQVEYGLTSAYGQATALASALVSSHSVGLSGLSASTAYHYRVKSKDAVGNLAVSGDFTFTTQAPPDTTPPTVPTNLSASAVSSSQIDLSWTASTDNVGVSGYTIYRGASQIATTSLTSYADTGLAPSTAYTYTVAAYDAAGNVSAQSAAASAVTPPLDPPSSLVAAYGFNEGSGSSTSDASSTSNTGTINGAAWTTSGQFGNTLSFNGNSSYVESADIDGLTPGTGATFEAWVFLNSAPTEVTPVFNKWSQTIDDEYLFGINPNQTLFFAWQTTGGYTWRTPSFNEANGTGQVPLNAWTHIAVVRSGATLSFYINGNLDASLNVMDTNPFRNGINTLRIGGQGRGARNRFFNGPIDEVRIYNRALSQAEIQNDMNKPVEGPASDTTPPTVSITAPAAGSTVAGTVTVSASATDNVGVVGVQFKLDGANLAAEEKFLPYEIPWDTTTAANGAHTLTAVARDAAGNTVTAAAVTLTVSNDTNPPVISAVAANGGSFAATVSWTTDEGSDTQVEYGPTTAYGSAILLDPSLVTSHSQTLSGLVEGTVYHYRVKSRDAAGNLAISGDLTFTTLDITPPTVSINAPAAGAKIMGTITVAASATDNVGVMGVQFRLDGANLGAEVATAPYSVSWNTTLAGNGSHTLTAVARDAAGNTATSTAVNVTVNNSAPDTTPPSVSITAPANGATISGTITVSANATDNVGVVGVQFKLDGANLGAELATAPYTLSWNTATAANGLHTLTAVARDAAGNTTTSSSVTVTVTSFMF